MTPRAVPTHVGCLEARAQATSGAALWAREPFAMMQRGGWIRAPADSGPDSPTLWLPVPEEDREDPEALDVEPLPARGGGDRAPGDRADLPNGVVLQLACALREGRWSASRIAAIGSSRGLTWSAVAPAKRGAWRPGIVVAADHRRARAEVGIGALRLGGAGALLRESMGIARAARRPGRAGAEPLRLEPAPSWTTPALQGVAGSLGSAPGVGRCGGSAWIALGRSEQNGDALFLGGATAQFRSAFATATRVALAAGVRRPAGPRGGDGPLAITLSAERAEQGTHVGLEFFTRGRERAALFGASRRVAPLLLSGRWRYRPWDREPTAAELETSFEARVGAGRAAARVAWRPWTAGALGDDGRIELETSAEGYGVGSTRLRIGQSGIDPDGVKRVERYALLETTVAEDRSRRLSLIATRRARRGSAGRSLGTTLGGRLTLGRGDGARVEARLEASRIDGAEGAAWGSGLGASGDAVLRGRSRSGVTVASQGRFGLGGWRLGYVLERTHEAGGPRPMSARMWLERRIGS
jgi:hypothetical protein